MPQTPSKNRSDFAAINPNLPYWQKQTAPLFQDLLWNIPERKTGRIAVVGGNNQNFSTPIRISEFLASNYPLETVATVLPDALKTKLPPLPNLNFTPSTTSGSFAKSFELREKLADADARLIIGDLSRNSATAIALADALKTDQTKTDEPKLTVLARDSVDLLATEAELLLENPNLIIVASLAQLQKLFRAIYYPRMIMLSQPLLPLLETLHKFTLSFPVALLTFHQSQIIVAHDGQIITTPIDKTPYTPLSLWSGQLAAKITAMNLYNPKKPLEATASILTK